MGHPEGLANGGKKPHHVAETEASQEAGVKGVVSKEPADVYPYSKLMPNGESRLCLVAVFPLRGTLEKVEWRERRNRERRWFLQSEAAELVDEGSVPQIIEAWR